MVKLLEMNTFIPVSNISQLDYLVKSGRWYAFFDIEYPYTKPCSCLTLCGKIDLILDRSVYALNVKGSMLLTSIKDQIRHSTSMF